MFYLQDGLLEWLGSRVSRGPLRFAEAFRQDHELITRMLKLHRMLEGPCEPIECDCGMIEILEHLAERHAEKAGADQPKTSSGTVTRMREYIHAHLEQQISLSDVAAVGHLSLYHALRSFRDVVGLPPHKYLLQVRVERAKEMLQKGESISSVALRLGFADQSHLTRSFKRILGVSPAKSLRSVS